MAQDTLPGFPAHTLPFRQPGGLADRKPRGGPMGGRLWSAETPPGVPATERQNPFLPVFDPGGYAGRKYFPRSGRRAALCRPEKTGK